MNWSKEDALREVPVKRSLSTTPPTYAPSLVFSHGKKYREHTFCMLSSDDAIYHVLSIPELRQMRCVASRYGWLLLRGCYSEDCCLFNPVLLKKIKLPPLIDASFLDGVVNAPPTDPNFIVLFFSVKRLSFIYCRIGDEKWMEKGLEPKNETYELMAAEIFPLSCMGKVYVMLHKGLVAIDDNFLTKVYEIELPQVSIPDPWKVSTDFFVECCGEIFRIVGVHLGGTDEILTLDIFKLDFPTMSWVKVQHLGDWIFLLAPTFSITLSSIELGAKGNCIYFSRPKTTHLNRFDVVDGTITTTLPLPKGLSHWIEPFWLVPNCKLQVKSRLANMEEHKTNPAQEQGCGNYLMPELVELIMSRLFLADCIRLRVTNKYWNTITPPVRSYTLLRNAESEPDKLPWFLSLSKNNKGLCNLRHPIYGDTYVMDIPELEGAIVRHANYGWWLMSQGTSLFFFNHTSMETVFLPDFEWYKFDNVTFSAPPTSPDYIVFGHACSSTDAVNIIVHRKGEDDWSSYWIDVSPTFVPSRCSPVFCDGLFYCLAKDGKLGVFDPNETQEKNMWKLWPKAIVPEAKVSKEILTISPYRSFIMECNGEILSVFVGTWGRPVSVYKLDRSEKKWNRLENLGDRVAFVSHTASILIPVPLKGIENRIYFPRFVENDNMFYSLSTGTYNCFGRKSSPSDWLNSSKNWNCTWLQFA